MPDDLVQIEGEGADDTAFFDDILDDDTEPTTTFLEDAMHAASGGLVLVARKHTPGGIEHDQSRHAGSKFSKRVLSLRGELLTPEDGRERLILVDSKGDVLERIVGTEGEEVEAPTNLRLRDPNERLTTHHNHPWDAPPSRGDMLRLGLEPGLASIYVHSPEASYYVAPKTDRDTLYRAVKNAYGNAHTELMAGVIASPPPPDQREAVRKRVHSQTAQMALERLASEGAIDYQVERFAEKHTPGGVQHDQSRHAGSRGTSTGRVWTGEQQPKAEKLTKLKTGEIGEQVAMRALEDKLGAEFRTVNVGLNNAPIDVVGDHTAVEVKAGLASNRKDAQRWRATIGQPGVAERAALKQMTSQEKRAHNDKKRAAIMKRKENMLAEFSQKLGRPVKPATVGVILSPDGSKADVYMVPGFHRILRWHTYATDDYYLGTYEVEQ